MELQCDLMAGVSSMAWLLVIQGPIRQWLEEPVKISGVMVFS
jgi:hypothetical protein